MGNPFILASFFLSLFSPTTELTNRLIFNSLISYADHRDSLNSSLTCFPFINILGSPGDFFGFLLASLTFYLEEQGGDPPDLTKAGLFHPQGHTNLARLGNGTLTVLRHRRVPRLSAQG